MIRFIKFLIKFITKLISIILLIGLFIGIGYLILYPNSSQIRLLKSNLDIKQQSYNYTLRIFSSISPKKTLSPQTNSKLASIEHISPDDLAAVSDKNDIHTTLEKDHTILYVESADIKAAIQEGADANTMKQGPWLFPISVAPGQKGNSVIIGHRFAEIPPSTNTFFNLDKIRVGDKIKINSDIDEFTYTVVATKVVEKDDRSVLAPSNDYRITLITCHPKWTSHQRLVIIGILDKLHRNI